MKSAIGSGTVVPIWTHWEGEVSGKARRKNVVRTHGGNPLRVKVLPGNPSLPLRVLLTGMVRPRNGGLNGSALGIDLELRGNEVRKLFYAGNFLGVLSKSNIDPDEFLQEVYRGLLTRNNGTCPWDAKKSSFGHYVHIVIRCVLANYLRRERLRDSREGVTDDGELGNFTDLRGTRGDVEMTTVLDKVFQSLPEEDRDTAHRFVMALYTGHTRKEALSQVERDDTWGGRILTCVRTALRG